jgi:hypothetical protein
MQDKNGHAKKPSASILASEGIRREQRICRTFSAGAMSTEKGKKL